MAHDDDRTKLLFIADTGEDVGWEWERDLESQGHGECWRVSHLEDGLAGPEPELGPVRACQRTDIRIYEDVCELLMEHPLVDATKVEVEVLDGVVVLRGHVCTRQEIALCNELIEDVAGVSGREILLRIRPDAPVRWDDVGGDLDGTGR